MDYGPLIMMGLMGLVAGWIANLILGRNADLASNLVTGFIGAYVGAFVQRHAKLDLMKIGNPLLEELAVAVIGAIVVILVARTIVSAPSRH
ncbi:MAG: GlsB/YeaQ/YmgE family stress response membrane protein [Hyphomicrobiaceae bacterium]|nr:GlsB/YeaQ/YmgE family stress response membrane protein [Hyphomicrobiaceae bacterium]